MGFRFQRRIKLGGGAGLNLSKSGVSTSVRSKYGSVGTKGFSVRTGVPGLTYRSRYRKGPDAGLIVLLMLAVLALLPFLLRALVLVAQLVLMAGAWIVRTLIIAPIRAIQARMGRQDAAQAAPHQALPPAALLEQPPSRHLRGPGSQ
jgi:hypothetical protein